MIHISSGIAAFSDGADCSVYADTGSATDIVADDMVVILTDYQLCRQHGPSASTNIIHVQHRADPAPCAEEAIWSFFVCLAIILVID